MGTHKRGGITMSVCPYIFTPKALFLSYKQISKCNYLIYSLFFYLIERANLHVRVSICPPLINLELMKIHHIWYNHLAAGGYSTSVLPIFT